MNTAMNTASISRAAAKDMAAKSIRSVNGGCLIDGRSIEFYIGNQRVAASPDAAAARHGRLMERGAFGPVVSSRLERAEREALDRMAEQDRERREQEAQLRRSRGWKNGPGALKGR